MRPTHRIAIAAALLPLGAIGAWLRLTSLGAMPPVDGDECWHLVQLLRLLGGGPVAAVTPTGNPMCFLQAPVQAPLLLAFGPRPWIARSASAAAGLATVALCYVWFARVFDRTTAAIAAATLAVLPAAIANSRLGYDSALMPLAVLLMLAAAARGKAIGLSLAFVFAYLSHPTAVFALPAALGLFVARGRMAPDGRRAAGWPSLLLGIAGVGGVAAALTLLTYGRAATQSSMAIHNVGPGGPHDPARFLALLGRFFLAVGRSPMPARDLAFWAVLLASGPAGCWLLVRRRQWDRLATVAGLVVGAAGLFVAGGSEILQPGMTRYGLALLVPAALAFACLVRALLIEPGSRRSTAARRLQVGGLVAGAWLLLLGLDLRALDVARCQDAPVGAESAWTWRADAPDYRLEALDRALDDGDLDRAGPGRRVVLCDGWDIRWMAMLLAVDRNDVAILDFNDPGRPVAELLRDGARVIALPGGTADHALPRWLPPRALHREPIGQDGRAVASVFRRVPGVAATWAVAGDFDGDGRAEPATYDADTGVWLVAGPGGAIDRLEGPAGGIPAPADFDGNGRAEAAVYLPDTGAWFAVGPEGAEPIAMRAVPGGVPIPGDFDGDGRAEPAVFDPARSAFLRNDPGLDVAFGQGTAYGGDPVPALADFDGDGRLDLAVYQADSGTWLLLRSTEGAAAVPTGTLGGIPMPGDLDGDGRADLVVLRPDAGTWEVVSIDGGAPRALGAPPAGLVAAGDFDGDGRLDLIALDDRAGSWSGPLSSGGRLARTIADGPTRRAAVGPDRPDPLRR